MDQKDGPQIWFQSMDWRRSSSTRCTSPTTQSCSLVQMLAKITSLYESLDPEQGFTDMSSLVSTIVTRRSKEKSSLEKLVKIFEDIYRNRKEKKGDLFESLHEGYATLPEHKRYAFNLDLMFIQSLDSVKLQLISL